MRRWELIGGGGLLAAFAFLYLWNLGGPELTPVDEARSGVIVRDMVEGGRWHLPRTPDGHLSEKPPVYYALCAGASSIVGMNEWALRGVSVAMAVGALVLAWLMAGLYGSPRASIVAVVSLGSNVVFVMWARSAMVDMTFTLFVTGGLAAWFAVRQGRIGAWSGSVVGGISFALAALTKGPLGLAIPLAVIVGNLIWVTRGRPWRAGIRWGPVAIGAVLAIVPTAAWYALGYLRGGTEFIGTCLLGENFFMPMGQSLGIAGSHAKSIFYYPSRQLLALLPMLAILPQMIAWAVRRDAGPARRQLVIWIAAGLAVLTIASNKRLHYLLPLQPAWAVLMGVAFDDAFRNQEARAVRWGFLGAGALFACAAVAAVLGLAMGFRESAMEMIADYSGPVFVMAMLSLLAGALLTLGAIGDIQSKVRALVVGGLLAAGFRCVLVDQVREDASCIRPFVDQVSKRIPKDVPVAIHPAIRGYGIDFYWRKHAIRDASAADRAQVYFVQESDLAELKAPVEVVGILPDPDKRRAVALVRLKSRR